MFDLRQLRYFVAVAEHEHVGRAAAQLNVTQSPLSRQIIELEANLGVTLFDRSNKRLKLNAVGRELLDEARNLLAHSDRLSRRIEGLSSGEAGRLQLGYVDGAIHVGLVSRSLRSTKFSKNALTLRLLPLRSQAQFEKLLQGEIDIGLTYAPFLDHSKLVSHRVHSEKFVLAVPESYGWKDVVTTHQLNGQKYIWLPANEFPDARAQFIRDCENAGFKPDIAMEATSPIAALDLASAGLGLAIVQESFARRPVDGVYFLQLPRAFDQSIEIYLIHRTNLTSQEQLIVDLIRATAQTPAASQ